MSEREELLKNVRFLGHASFQIRGSSTVYTDPYELGSYRTLAPADVVLVTHSHYDHCSAVDIERVSALKTVVLASNDCIESLKRLSCSVRGISPNEEIQVAGVGIKAVPAYNPDKQFHPRENLWNGYVFTVDGVRYYHPGDTDLVPEMEGIEADVVFLPVGGTYTMDARDACEAVKRISPKAAIPMHYGSVVGSIRDAEEFVRCVGEIGVLLPQMEP
ncbi:MAG: MBL fold metallo-hydrolase [Spirochaetes bacterium]|nr:MBL fold metallo-hydrolase [Spirochaetota bacterium]